RGYCDHCLTTTRMAAPQCISAPPAASLQSRAFCNRQKSKITFEKIETKSACPGCRGGVREQGSVHNPDTMKLLRDVLDDALAALRPDERARASRSMLAARLLEGAAAGERNPARPLSAALSTGVTSAP